MEQHITPFKGWNFQRDIILWVVRWYCKYGISYCELQEMLAERDVFVDHTAIYHWVSVMRLKWKNGCPGTCVTLPIFALGTLMKPALGSMVAGFIFTGPSTTGV